MLILKKKSYFKVFFANFLYLVLLTKLDTWPVSFWA